MPPPLKTPARRQRAPASTRAAGGPARPIACISGWYRGHVALSLDAELATGAPMTGFPPTAMARGASARRAGDSCGRAAGAYAPPPDDSHAIAAKRVPRGKGG
eukprot:1112998-Prymnesium_polylepis.1